MTDKDIEAGRRAAEDVRATMRTVLDRAGIDEAYLTAKLKEELDAHETKIFAYQGGIVDTQDVIAWDVRQHARQDAHKLRGDYPAEKQEMDANLHIEITNYGNTILNKNGPTDGSDNGPENGKGE